MDQPPSETTPTIPAKKLQEGIASLESKIKLLSELQSRIESLRHIPTTLLRSTSTTAPPANALSVPVVERDSVRLRNEFEVLKTLAEKLRSDEVQVSLKEARESESKNPLGLEFHRTRKETPKLGPPSPESPQPYPSFQTATTALSFPTWDHITPSPVIVGSLPEFIRGWNKTHKSRVHIYIPALATRNHASTMPDLTTLSSIVVRFVIRDVVTIYGTLGHLPKHPKLVLESSTAFGPREKKPPHSQSDYVVYQQLSQQLAKVAKSHPQAPLQLIMDLLASYEDLFVRKCSACKRVLSVEGHVPPVARVWTGSEWDARHSTCLQQ